MKIANKSKLTLESTNETKQARVTKSIIVTKGNQDTKTTIYSANF